MPRVSQERSLVPMHTKSAAAARASMSPAASGVSTMAPIARPDGARARTASTSSRPRTSGINAAPSIGVRAMARALCREHARVRTQERDPPRFARQEGERLVPAGVEEPDHDGAGGLGGDDAVGLGLLVLARRSFSVGEHELGAQEPDALGPRWHVVARGADVHAHRHEGERRRRLRLRHAGVRGEGLSGASRRRAWSPKARPRSGPGPSSCRGSAPLRPRCPPRRGERRTRAGGSCPAIAACEVVPTAASSSVTAITPTTWAGSTATSEGVTPSTTSTVGRAVSASRRSRAPTVPRIASSRRWRASSTRSVGPRTA